MQKEIIVGHGFFDQLAQQKQFRGIDDSVDALLIRLLGGERLEGGAEQDDRGVAALVHGHVLQGMQRGVFLDGIGGKQFFNNHHLVADLGETDQKIAVRGRRMDFVTKFLQCGLGGFEPFGR